MTFLIDFGVKSGVALGAAFLWAFALRRGSASLRYALWVCALAAVLVLPLVTWVGPRWNIDRGAWRRATATVEAEQAATISVVVLAKKTAPELPWSAIAWMAGTAVMLVRVGAGHWRVRSLFGSAEKIRDERWLAIAQEIAKGIGFRRSLTLKLSTATDVPLSYGLVCATVLLPGESEHWNDERRRIVLAHEMIHARRVDSLWGLLAQCALAVNWFNPLAWLAVREFRKDQERSCDDAVVAAGTANTVYAAHLVDLARSIAIPEPALGMAERFDLEGRVHSLLDSGRGRKAASRKMCAAMFAGAMAAIVPLAAVRAQSTSKIEVAGASRMLTRNQIEVAKNKAMTTIALNRSLRRAPAHGHASAWEAPQAASAIAGSVYDPSGAVVPSATIILKGTGQANEEVTDSNGSYKLRDIPAGEYVLKVRAQGFAVYQKTVSLEAGTPATVDVHLAVGEAEESVMITAKRPEAAGISSAPQRIKVGGMVQAFSLIKKVTPAYPPDAKAEGIEGSVLLRAIVSKSGSLLSIVPVNTGVDPRLASAAMGAVSQWQYQPALLNGEPVEVITTVTVSFRLN